MRPTSAAPLTCIVRFLAIAVSFCRMLWHRTVSQSSLMIVWAESYLVPDSHVRVELSRPFSCFTGLCDCSDATCFKVPSLLGPSLRNQHAITLTVSLFAPVLHSSIRLCNLPPLLQIFLSTSYEASNLLNKAKLYQPTYSLLGATSLYEQSSPHHTPCLPLANQDKLSCGVCGPTLSKRLSVVSARPAASTAISGDWQPSSSPVPPSATSTSLRLHPSYIALPELSLQPTEKPTNGKQVKG